MDEKTYLQTENVCVTSSRVEISGQTFAVRNITSVKVTDGGGRPWLGALLAIVGVGAINTHPVFGVTVLVMAAIAAWRKMMTRKLILSSASGEAVAMESTD